ncbi:MAG: SdpI family protein [Steroidobacteraceae bacterium]
MRKFGRYWLAMTLVAAAFATSVVLYPRLPAIIPTHWNAAGVINGWMPKSRGAFVAPVVSLVIVAGLILFEPIQIEEDGDDLKVRYYPTIVASVAGLNSFANLWVLMAGMGWHRALPSHLAIAVGLLLVVLGNSLGKVRQNGVVGIRTPWTLADEEVWARTNRVGGWLIVLAGLVMAATGIMGFRMVPGLIAVGAAAAVSVGYSYVIWLRVNRGNGKSS